MGAASSAQIAALAKKYNKSIQQVMSEIKGSSYEYGDKVLSNDAARTSKTVAPTTSAVTKSPDYTKEIDALYDPLLSAADTSLAAQKAGLNDEFSGLATRLKETAGKSEAGLTESMNRYGLLESGRNAAGIGKIQSDLSSDINKSDIQRAIAEADLVLSNANYKSTVGLAKMGALEKLNPNGFDQQQFQESIRRFNLEKDLSKYGLDMGLVKDAASVYSVFLSADKKIDPYLYDKMKSIMGGT